MRRFGKGFLIMAFSLLSASGKVVLAADPVERALVACENELTTFVQHSHAGSGSVDDVSGRARG